MSDDLIGRQDAIDSIMKEPSEVRYPVFYAEKIRQLPSAQTTHESIFQHAQSVGSVESIAKDIYNTDATDTIKRSDALKVCKGHNGSGYTWASIAYDIRHLPSAQRKGKWIWMGDTGDSRWMCSVCKGKEKVPTIMGEPIVWEFCPNCGAEMVKGEEDEVN